MVPEGGEHLPYAPCRDDFTAQQNRRMLCRTCDELSGWIDGQDGNADETPDLRDIARDGDRDGLPGVEHSVV